MRNLSSALDYFHDKSDILYSLCRVLYLFFLNKYISLYSSSFLSSRSPKGTLAPINAATPKMERNANLDANGPVLTDDNKIPVFSNPHAMTELKIFF